MEEAGATPWYLTSVSAFGPPSREDDITQIRTPDFRHNFVNSGGHPSLGFLVFTPLVLSVPFPGVFGSHKQCTLRPVMQCPVAGVARAQGMGCTLPSVSLFLGGQREQNARHRSTSALSETDGSHAKAASCRQRFRFWAGSWGAGLVHNWEVGARKCSAAGQLTFISGAAVTAQEKQGYAESPRVEEPVSGTGRHSSEGNDSPFRGECLSQ